MYSDKVRENFTKPQNMGKMENPDGVGEVGNAVCGDMMKIYIRIKDNIITDIKVETFGCVAAIATSSMTTQMAKGMTLEEAKKLSRGEVAEALDGLPPQKMHCSNLAADALHKAIEDYEKKQNST
ncbi:MAG: Fe-S cluster assembly scaffold protein NifU [Candidatus Thorarchaeota archaeon]|jgi:nitrogen fixation NifU-like protein